MELDKRIVNGRKPFDCVDAGISETVKSFIGKKGYFANHISEFTDISDLEEDVLTFINPDEPDCEVYKASCETWEYFLPSEWVKEPKKKYREYKNLDEFFDVTGLEIGDLIKLKFPGNNVAELLIVGGCDNSLFIGIHKYTFKQLFEMVEISISGEWQPFGVIDEDKE